MTAPGDVGTRIEKLMTLSPREFAASLARLLPDAGMDAGDVLIALGAGSLRICCEPVAPLVIASMPPLPRARVTLDFKGVAAEDRAAFLRRFDIAFQRGGG